MRHVRCPRPKLAPLSSRVPSQVLEVDSHSMGKASESESASAMKGIGERGIEGERGEGERSCTSRLTQMGREALLRALVQLEALEAMLPKEPQKPMPSDPCHDRFIRRHWKKLQKFPPPASWETRPRASRKRAAS